MKRKLTTTLYIIICVAAFAAPTLRTPLRLPMELSANFGELRPNHFHSGLDFKTQGRTGHDVLAAADGYIAAVEVEPGGYGRAVYVVHPQLGLMTIYGHLEAFTLEVDRVVRDSMYAREEWIVDLDFAPERFPVKQGDVIGISGNAGHSGGPHVHMDVRRWPQNVALDPLQWYAPLVTDREPPYAKALALYDAAGLPMADGKAGDTFRAWGKVYPAIEANDAMTGVSNIFGVKTLILSVDGKVVWGRRLDAYPMAATRAINTLVDYDRLCRTGRWMQWTRVPASRPLPSLVGATLANGAVNVDTERDYRCEWILTDHHGNTTRVPFTIRGDRNAASKATPRGTLMHWQGLNTWRLPGATVIIPPRSAYDDFRFAMSVDSAATHPDAQGRFYKVGCVNVPLASPMRLEMNLPDKLIADSSRYVIARLDGSKLNGVETRRENGRLVADIYSMGTYVVALDRTPPSIARESDPVGDISVKIDDDISGIATWQCLINGRWEPMEYDLKNDRLWISLDARRYAPGTVRTVSILVTDRAGNSRLLRTNL